MASENETVADIVKELRDNYEDAIDICVLDAPEYADRIEAAHKREVDGLREYLKEAIAHTCLRFNCYWFDMHNNACTRDNHDYPCFILKLSKALEGEK